MLSLKRYFPSSPGERALYAAALLLLALSIYIHFAAGFVGDKNWMLMVARLFLAGRKLYVDILEVNPPLIFWLYALPVKLSQLGGVEDYQALVFLVLCVAAVSAVVSTQAIAFHPCFADKPRRQAHHALLVAMVLVAWTNSRYFADREHLFFTLTLPYVLRFMPSLARTRLKLPLRIVIGVMAAIGFCIKPHCLIVFAGVQAITLLRERSAFILASVENVIIYAAGALYLGAVLIWCPEYITVVLPMAVATYSSCSNGSKRWMYFSFCAFTFALTFIDFRLRDTSPYRRDIFYLLMVCALQFAYASANNGWGYTYYPLSAMLLITTGWVLWEFLYLRDMPGAREKRFAHGARDCWLNLGLHSLVTVAIAFLVVTADCSDKNECALSDALAGAIRDNHARSFAMLSTEFYYLAPLARESGAAFETRFYHLWMIPKFLRGGAEVTHRYHWILEYVAGALASDLNARRPDVVFVDVSPIATKYDAGGRMDLIAFLSPWGKDLGGAWGAYALVQHINYCPPEKGKPSAAMCAYDVYRRREDREK